MEEALKNFVKTALGAARDLAPIVLVIAFFQIVVVQTTLEDWVSLTVGGFEVLLGLTLFIYGLQLALFPIGESLAFALARKGSVVWLVLFAFLLGFGTTIAEPALIAVAGEASRVAADAGLIANTDEARADYVFGLRLTVALSVGVAILLGVLRIVLGWSLPIMIISGYVLVMLMTTVAPEEIVGVAYDSGAVTTSTVTVPLVAALGVGLASSIKDRNPMTDGFGLIAFASLTPIIFVMAYGGIVAWT